MTLSSAQLLVSLLGYLAVLFAVGYLADRGKLPARLLHHPVVYVLSLGVIAGGFAIYGSAHLAHQYGYAFLLYYIGIALMLLLSPLLMFPVMRICRIYQLSSLADLLAFRFRSPWIGALATLGMLAAVLPLLAMQIQVVFDTVHLLSGDRGSFEHGQTLHDLLPVVFCVLIAVFTIYFGSRPLKDEERHEGLVAAIAFESLVKLLALATIGLVALFSIFDGPGGLEEWLAQNPALVDGLSAPMRVDSAHALLLIFFAGAVTMPHIFHMAFSESPDGVRLRTASWGLPLYLLLLSLPMLPITWASTKLDADLPALFSVLVVGINSGSGGLSIIAFLAGTSAASAVIIVSTLALANMALKHLVLPLQLRGRSRLESTAGIYAQLIWLRSALITAIILAGYLFFRTAGTGQLLVDLGVTAFLGTLQFLPGLLATIYWPRANKLGLTAGLAAGFLTWYLVAVLPLFMGDHSTLPGDLFPYLFGDVASSWTSDALISLGVNISLFFLVSMLTHTSDDERAGAQICSMDDLARPMRRSLGLQHPEEFRRSLAQALGERTAKAEVNRALHDLRLAADESRPYALRQLRDRIEANLSGLLGPAVAFDIMQRCIPYQLDAPQASEDISLIERRLDSEYRSFTGLAADLDNLRRYHRETLRDLPIGVFSLGRDGEVLMWNRAMESTTGVRSEDVVGSYLGSLPGDWATMLDEFVSSGKSAEHKLRLREPSDTGRWISLHKAAVESSSRMSEDQVIVVEDLTDYQMLEQELLHSERLASIGRLAAGVAHEIGNPVTGIACLAQNLEVEDDISAVSEAATEIRKQTERVTRIVESLVNFAHTGREIADPASLQPVNVADCVDEAIHLLQLDHSAKPVDFNNRCHRESLVLGESQRLLQVIVNLLGNARDASDDGGRIDIDTVREQGTLHIQVTDFGTGIPEEIQGQVFEPFFTTKEPGEGTGLGLSLVYSILDNLGGRVSLQSPLHNGPGTCFKVSLSSANYSDEYR
jgi:PAS domain S-box-containing protein